MPQKTIELRFPAAGVVRRWGFHASVGRREVYPAVWAMNVRLEGGLATRLRGGSFTGISAGSRPSSIVYQDRTLTFSGRVVTASRVSDSSDTTMSVDVSDVFRPTFFQFAEADGSGPTVVALIPHKDQYLLGFTASETWVQQGNPVIGPMRRVSDQVGIIGADAWCVHHDTVYFLSSRGLYSVGADGSGLVALSEDALPEDLADVSDTACTLTYQHSDRGVYIHKTGTDWFFDTERRGFWPFDTGETDSHVLLGPIRLGQANSFGRVLNLHGYLATSSADVTWRIVTGETEEAAADNAKAAIVLALASGDYSSYVSASGTWIAGRARLAYPRTRAVCAVLWLHSEGSWAYEAAILEASVSGKWR